MDNVRTSPAMVPLTAGPIESLAMDRSSQQRGALLLFIVLILSN